MAEHRSPVNELRRPRQRLPRRRLVRWSLVGLAGLALLLGACVATAWVLFRLRGPELIRAELEGALVTALGRPARVDAVTFRPWPVALRVSGVAVASGASWEQGTLLRLDHGDVSVRLESLWRRRLVLGVTLAGIEVTATAAGGGGLAIPIPPDTIVIGPVTARLAVVRVRQGRIVYRDPDAPWTVEVRGLDADGRPQPDALALSAAAESLRFESPALHEHVEGVRADGTIRAGEVAAQRVRFRWEGHEAELSGQLRPTPEGLAVLGAVRGEASLGPIASRAGMTWPLTGIAKFDATLEGPVAAPRVEGRITVPELAAGPFRARSVRLEGSFGDGALHLRDIHGDLPGGPVRGAFTLSPDRESRRATGPPHAGRAPAPGSLRLPRPCKRSGRRPARRGRDRARAGDRTVGRRAAGRDGPRGAGEPPGAPREPRRRPRAVHAGPGDDGRCGTGARDRGSDGDVGSAGRRRAGGRGPAHPHHTDGRPRGVALPPGEQRGLLAVDGNSRGAARRPSRGADRGPPGGRRARRRAGRGPAPHRPRPWGPADAARDLGLGRRRMGGGEPRPGRARQAARASCHPLAEGVR